MKRIISAVLAAIMLFALTTTAFADNSAGKYTLYMDRNGKIVKDAGGTKIYGRTQEKIFQKFYKLMKEVPVNWDKFDYAEYEVTVGDDGAITFGKQTMAAMDGSSVVSDNAEVIIFETPEKFHAASSGNAAVTHFDFFGNDLGTSQITAKALSTGATLVASICPKCSQDQGMEFHLMACGHYSCEVGAAGHGKAPCGNPGHMNCDGKDHSTCPNCLNPLCTGEHGVGICRHVHSWQCAGGAFSPDHKYWVNRYYCPVCGAYTFTPIEIPVPEEESETE